MADFYYTRFSIMKDNVRLDKCLADVLPAYSRVLLQKLINGGGVAVNGKICTRPAQKIAAGAVLAVEQARLAQLTEIDDTCRPESLSLQIVYEDEALLVVNKASGMVTHPGHGNRHGTLQSGLLHHHAGAAALARAGIVHRLDKDTSGLLVVAKTVTAQKQLLSQFKTRQISREYLALVCGAPPATGIIRGRILRHRHERQRMAVTAGGKEAVTNFICQRRWRGFALLHCKLETGRTHQIRVHLEHNGYPVMGDKVYRRRAPPLPVTVPRQMLHAETLRLLHPLSGALHEWHCPPPPDMQQVLAALDRQQAEN